jgi:hypothetical protein
MTKEIINFQKQKSTGNINDIIENYKNKNKKDPILVDYIMGIIAKTQANTQATRDYLLDFYPIDETFKNQIRNDTSRFDTVTQYFKDITEWGVSTRTANIAKEVDMKIKTSFFSSAPTTKTVTRFVSYVVPSIISTTGSVVSAIGKKATAVAKTTYTTVSGLVSALTEKDIIYDEKTTGQYNWDI